MSVRGRFAPSPSGRMHLGNAWTALLAWLSTRSRRGVMVLRMEDLDPSRSKPHFAAAILEDMAWLGLDWDEGPDKGGPHAPYTQDQRRGLYGNALEALAARGLVYPCYCTRAELLGPARNHASAPHAGEGEAVYSGACRGLDAAARASREAAGRRPSLRLMAGEGGVTFTDLALGPQAQDVQAQCGDFIVRRSDGVHAYQLAVSVDDAAQGVTEVVRGADLLDSTGRQLRLIGLLGGRAPAYAHVPLLVDAQGRRLSKRRQDVDLGEMRAAGVAAETVVGYLGWKAGLLPAPRPCAAWELVDGFGFGALPAGPVVVADNWMEERA